MLFLPAEAYVSISELLLERQKALRFSFYCGNRLLYLYQLCVHLPHLFDGTGSQMTHYLFLFHELKYNKKNVWYYITL